MSDIDYTDMMLDTAEPSPKGYVLLGYFIAIYIVVLASMTIHTANEKVSDSYKESVQWVGGIALAAAFGTFVAAPVMALSNKVQLTLYLSTVMLAGLIGALASMSIDAINKSSHGESYKDGVRATAGIGYAAAAITLVVGPYMLVSNKKILKLFLMVVMLALLISAVGGLGIHLASSTSDPSSKYKDSARAVAGVAIFGAACSMLALPMVAWKSKGGNLDAYSASDDMNFQY